ncbi:UNVERIFIED_CONTAM: hypothetical protein HDU68_010816 [Siphonaria sp. JEL0065]|nr:hypothetical protein HDU68_010816 [Siphonaria sp. JEL0065]
MGCNASTTSDAPALATASHKIDKKIKEEKQKLDSEQLVKLLLLGPGEAGKSTVLKQLMLMYGKGFSDQEIQTYAKTIKYNLITCFTILIRAMDGLKIPYGFDPTDFSAPGAVEATSDVGSGGRESKVNSDGEIANNAFRRGSLLGNPKSGDGEVVIPSYRRGSLLESGPLHAPRLLRKDSSTSIPRKPIELKDPVAIAAATQFRNGKRNKYGPLADLAKEVLSRQVAFIGIPGAAKRLSDFWYDPGVQYCFSRAHEYQMLDCCQYVMKHMDRICTNDYLPTEEDILHSRTMTIAVTETRFRLDTYNLIIYDVGGQRSERKKWAQFFTDTQAIIFIVAIGSYDQVCSEDGETNRMIEAMNLFSSICNHPLFKSIDMVLFLNKIDLFKQKITLRPISNYFPEYKGPDTYEESSRFFKKQFQAINKYPKDKKIFAHYTHATDSELTKKVLGSVVASITDSMLKSTGFV